MDVTTKKFSLDEVIALLNRQSPKMEAALLVLRAFGEASTSDIAGILGWDRSNTARRLEALVEDGLVEIVDEAYHDGKSAGRPTRIWSAI